MLSNTSVVRKRLDRSWRLCAFTVVGLLVSTPVGAYPEFQAYSQENSGMGVSCAMCHAHPDGPEGAAHGQIGGLTKEALEQLNEARSAFEPGQTINSPILNKFGNDMVRQLGRKKLIALKQSPAELGTELDQKSDLDNDGATDAREYNEGTHPLHKSSGNPWLLFIQNFKKHLFSIVMVTFATLCILYGLRNLHMALDLSHSDQEMDDVEPEEPEPAQAPPAAVSDSVPHPSPTIKPVHAVASATSANSRSLVS